MLDWLKRDPRAEPSIVIGQLELPLIIRRHARAKRMTLRLAPDGKAVKVTIPDWGRTADALFFARSRQEWLARQLAAMPEPKPLGPGSVLRFRGQSLLIDYAADAMRKPVFADNTLRLGGPAASLERRVKRWLAAEARNYLLADLAEYCRRAERETPELALSNARRRWGSCAPGGTIRVNWRLIMAPDFVRRSVVAHEVAHLSHFDHSARFHAHLAALFEGDLDAANQWLKRDGPGLYYPFG